MSGECLAACYAGLLELFHLLHSRKKITLQTIIREVKVNFYKHRDGNKSSNDAVLHRLLKK